MRRVLAVLLLITVAGAVFPKPLKDGGIISNFVESFHKAFNNAKSNSDHSPRTDTQKQDDHKDDYLNVDVSNAEWVCINLKTKQVKAVTKKAVEKYKENRENYPSEVSEQTNKLWQGLYTTSEPTYQSGQEELPNQPNNQLGTEEQSQPNSPSGQDYEDNLNLILTRALTTEDSYDTNETHT